jgi:uncharacterized protein
MSSVLYRVITCAGFLALIGCAAPTPTRAPTPTSAPTAALSADPHPITFTTPDGATLAGELRGAGSTAVIFSVMGNCKQGWTELAEDVAQQGLLSLTYVWRACRPNGTVDDELIQNFVDDTRGAINFVREQGATRIILVGASLGGCASAKLLVESGAAGLIVLASPPEISQWGFQINAADLQTDAPKLFITAENDSVVEMSATRELYGLAAEPKEWQTYSGQAHGTDLFETDNKDTVKQKIVEFILRIQGS